MNRDFDTRARQASAGLRETIDGAALTMRLPVGPQRPRLAAFLRPAWVAALLVLGSAVGVAMVLDQPSPPPTPAPIVSTTTTSTTEASTTTAPTTSSTLEEKSTSSTVAPVAPAAPSTTEALDEKPPILEILSPKDGAEMEEKTITFSGATEPGARVFAGRYEADVDSNGRWEIVLVLQEGSNVARFIARDDAGNETRAAVTVYYVTPTPTTEATTPREEPPKEVPDEKPAEFSANAVYGSCSEAPPFDIYHGTGEPGSVVEISSEFGSGSVKVGPEGGWELKVLFPEAPPEEPFVVHVHDSLGREAAFEFVYQP